MGSKGVREPRAIWHLECYCTLFAFQSISRLGERSSMRLYIFLHYDYLFQLYNKCMEKKPKHVRMLTERGLAAEEINKNTWKHIIRDSLSWALLTTNGGAFEGVRGRLPLAYQTSNSRRVGWKGQPKPTGVLWAQVTTANDVKGKSPGKAGRSLPCPPAFAQAAWSRTFCLNCSRCSLLKVTSLN